MKVLLASGAAKVATRENGETFSFPLYWEIRRFGRREMKEHEEVTTATAPWRPSHLERVTTFCVPIFSSFIRIPSMGSVESFPLSHPTRFVRRRNLLRQSGADSCRHCRTDGQAQSKAQIKANLVICSSYASDMWRSESNGLFDVRFIATDVEVSPAQLRHRSARLIYRGRSNERSLDSRHTGGRPKNHLSGFVKTWQVKAFHRRLSTAYDFSHNSHALTNGKRKNKSCVLQFTEKISRPVSWTDRPTSLVTDYLFVKVFPSFVLLVLFFGTRRINSN